MPTVVVIADGEMRPRIRGVLAGHGLEPAAEIGDSADAGLLGLGPSAIVVLACEIDAPGGVTLLRRLRREAPAPAIVVISSPSSGLGVRRALDAGADALVFATELELTLASAVEAVAAGQAVVPRRSRAGIERPALSHREHQVVQLVGAGLTNAEIATRLFLAESTIKSHLSSIFTKFGVRSRKEILTTMERAAE